MLESLRDIPIVGDVRGAGFFQAIELVKDRETKETFNDEESEHLLRGFLSGALYHHGLICRADDRGDPVIQLAPPLIADTRAVRRDRAGAAHGADRGQRAALAADGRVLTVRDLVGALELELARGRARRELADPLGPRLRAGRPDAVAVGRRAAAEHRDGAAATRTRSAPTSAAWSSTSWPGWASASASTTPRCRRRSSMRPARSTSRCSRCPTRCRSSRSPSAPSRA